MSTALISVWSSPESRAITGSPACSVSEVESRSLVVARPGLEKVIELEDAPWLLETLDELRDIQATGEFIPGVGDLRVTRETADKTRKLLVLASVYKLPRPRIIAFSGGGVGLEWRLNGRELTFSIYPGDEEAVYEGTDEHGETTGEGELALDEDEKISAVLARFMGFFPLPTR